MVEVAGIELFGVDTRNPRPHIQAGGLEQVHTLAPHPGVGWIGPTTTRRTPEARIASTQGGVAP